MAEYRYTVFRSGVHESDILERERTELERIGARQVVLPPMQSEDEFIEKTRGADGLIVVDERIPRRVLESWDRCKVVLRTGVGVDTVDVDAATELGIAVVNLPDLWSREVANHAVALLLACNRRLRLLDKAVRVGGWSSLSPGGMGSLHGESLGLVGLGRIGRAMARRAAAFEMDLLAYDPYAEPSVFDDLGVASVPFDELLHRSDYVSIHCPRTDETFHMFDEETFRQMRPTAYLINTARGPIVDQAALMRALQEGWIAGAGLDVLEREPPGAVDPILRMENVILTPHSGFYSDAAMRELPVRCGQEVARVLTGRMPLNLVNPEVLDRLPLVPE